MKSQEITKAAKDLFNKYGFKKVSVDEIAQNAGVTKKTVYSYFSSKEEILQECIKEELEGMKKIIEDVEKENNDFFEEIHKTIYKLLKYKKQKKFFKTLITEGEVLRNKVVIDNLKVIDMEIKEYIKEKLIKAQGQKKINVENLDIMTFLIYEMYFALMFNWDERNPKINEKDISDSILSILKYGLRGNL